MLEHSPVYSWLCRCSSGSLESVLLLTEYLRISSYCSCFSYLFVSFVFFEICEVCEVCEGEIAVMAMRCRRPRSPSFGRAFCHRGDCIDCCSQRKTSPKKISLTPGLRISDHFRSFQWSDCILSDRRAMSFCLDLLVDLVVLFCSCLRCR
jgi:hypothetical protein